MPIIVPRNMAEHTEIQEQIIRAFMDGIPHNRDIGLQVDDISSEAANVHLPFREEFLGDLQQRLWHTSVALSVMDSTCALSIYGKLTTYEPVATLDLRADHLRPAVADKALRVQAVCYRLTPHIAFARGFCYQDDPERPTSTCTATFMRTGRPQKSAVPDV